METEPTTTEAVADVDAELTTESSELIEDELLVEEVSIDGMCGVY